MHLKNLTRWDREKFTPSEQWGDGEQWSINRTINPFNGGILPKMAISRKHAVKANAIFFIYFGNSVKFLSLLSVTLSTEFSCFLLFISINQSYKGYLFVICSMLQSSSVHFYFQSVPQSIRRVYATAMKRKL